MSRGCDVFAGIVMNLNPVLAALATQDPDLLSLPPNEAGQLCARSILTLNKWWASKEKRQYLLPSKGNIQSPHSAPWMDKILKGVILNSILDNCFKFCFN